MPISEFTGVIISSNRTEVSFERFNWIMGHAGYAYYQILHTGSDHWVTIKAVSDYEFYLYDSILSQPTHHVLKQIASIAQTRLSQINIKLEKVFRQVNPDDCGVYAIAYLTDLCFDRDPATRRYDHKQTRKHLIKCFEIGKMTPFPSTKSSKRVASTKKLNVYCQCRLPNAMEHAVKGEPLMVKCHFCDNLYHHTCVDMTIEEAKKINSGEVWFCDYTGCNHGLGDIFDSD